MRSQSCEQEGTRALSPNHVLAKSLRLAQDLYSGDASDTRIVSSNLRRSMNTVTIALQDRLVRNGERVEILSSLQEISRNVDTISTAGAHGVQANMGGHMSLLDAEKVFDARMNKGNKSPSVRGSERIKDFVQWLFSQRETKFVVSGHRCARFRSNVAALLRVLSLALLRQPSQAVNTSSNAASCQQLFALSLPFGCQDLSLRLTSAPGSLPPAPPSLSLCTAAGCVCVSCVSQSLYFRWFFRMYLPHGLQHIAKQKKVANGGIGAFDLVQDATGAVQILPSSITSVYLGFAK